ncbi:MAG: 30S ribosomal protein S6--L-glutamate ligase [bacterium]|nr:30S ribosomal protein S6--L-glutamate ligase [bacterium]
MKIAILSRETNNYSTQRLLKAAKKAGHETVVIDHTKCYVDIEKNNPGIHYNGQKITDIDAIIPRIGQSVTSYGAAIVRQFEMKQIYSSVSSLGLVRSRDKLRSLQLLARAGIGIPKTIFARSASKTAITDELIDLVGGAPLVVKLLEGTHGLGVVLAETKKAAKSVIEAFYGLGTSILIQEYIDEAEGSDIRAFVVGNEVIAAMMRKSEEGEFRANLHRGGKAENVELTKKETNIAIRAAHTLGLQVAGVDFVRSNRGPLVLEVNSSPGLLGIEKQTGSNIAGEIIDYVATKAASKRKRDRIGA